MITKAKTVGVYVSDQDRALDFYVNALGFEKRRDDPMGSEAGWIEVALAGAETVSKITPAKVPMRSSSPGGVYSTRCDDIRSTYEELRDRGVEFTEEPSEQPWGMWAQFKDVDGNEFGLIQSEG